MKHGAWKYFREGEDILNVLDFLNESTKGAMRTVDEGTPDERTLFTKKIRIVIDIFEDEN